MAAAFGLSLSQASAAAGSTPDTQEAYPPAGWLAMTGMAQTFTPNHSGQLYQVSLYSGTAGSQAATFYINIWSATAGTPSSPCAQDATNPLTTKEVRSLGTNGWFEFPLAHSVSVVAHTQYAIVVCSPIANMFRWSFENGETYSGGAAFIWFGSSWFPGGSSVKDFDFKAWVSGNSAPTVAPDSPSVSSPEGTAPTQTGTYSDADGDTVAITASAGSVKQTGTSSGTWSWTQAASDEAPTQTVFIKADDGHGLSNQTSFTVDIKPAALVAQILTDPVSVPEGTTVPFTGGATSPYPAETFYYAWTVKTSSGATLATGSESAFSFTPADEGAYAVTLKVTDDGGMSDTTLPVTVNETDITPTAKIDSILPSDLNLTSPLIIAPGESLNFGGSFSDAAPQDTHTASWNFGDGSPAAGGWSTTHSYAFAGTYTVTLTVKDDDGVSGSTTTTVQVLTAQQVMSRMETYIGGLPGLNAGQKNSLIAKLNAASDAIARGDNKAASNQLRAFVNELEADYSSNRISLTAYNSLRADAHTVQGVLGTYNRFLEWWPLQA